MRAQCIQPNLVEAAILAVRSGVGVERFLIPLLDEPGFFWWVFPCYEIECKEIHGVLSVSQSQQVLTLFGIFKQVPRNLMRQSYKLTYKTFHYS
ncbi:hypothetical protein GDO81_028643 [Engystomops pustulosus]|uniref:Uncharacterized protein n=1 Tax=Engystomops pustulosus TaxID=76066 RepID=A0AAV6YKY2_ENGPU|nr:hypothetical protein GDO81_028643 [Engystomops pustulosus]